MTEKELHNKTISEIERIDRVGVGDNRMTNYNVGFVTIEDLKAWAVAIVKELECENVNDIPPYCIQYRCGERPTASRIDPTTFCFNCRLKMFLKERFELTEEDLCQS